MARLNLQGIITYIYLENFVTYNKVAIRPGKNLNVIIGPNGTGKSTIVCAIVLGLGGKPSTIGRALHVAEYVKAGCQEAKIEIHLKTDTDADVVIKRIFNIQGKSIWYIDDSQCNVDAVKKLTKTFNIQIDNLCQFLPQDKVQEFSKMNAQELLHNTQKSVGDPVLLEYHKKLIDNRNAHKSLQINIENKKKLLESKIQIYTGLKHTVSGIKEKNSIKKKITSLKQKKAWMLYDQMRKDLIKLKKKKTNITTKVTDLETQIKPIKEAIDKINSAIALLKNSINNHTHKVNTERGKLKRMMDDIIDCDKLIKDCENTCKQRIQTENSRDKEIELERKRREKLENDLSLIMADIGSEESLMKQKEKMIRLMDVERSLITSLSNKQHTLRQEEENLVREIRNQETELQLLSVESKRLQLLRQKSIDTYKGVLWLRENRDKFSAPIHEPMLLNINVIHESYAKYFENIIAFRDLTAFVCEKSQDMSLLLQYLRDEQKLQVNAVHSDPDKTISMEPHIPLEHIKQFGFTHYLASLFEAPLAVVKYLVPMYNLNNIPVGTKSVEDNTDRIPHSLSCYFSADNMYVVRVSKYSREKCTRMQSVSKSGMLSIVSDKGKQQRIEERIKVLGEKKTDAYTRARRIEGEIKEHNNKLEACRADRIKVHEDVEKLQLVKSRITISSKKIEDLQNERSSIEQIKESCTSEIKDLIGKQLRIYREYNAGMEECFKCITEHERVKLTLKLQNQTLQAKLNSSRDLRSELEAAEADFRQINTEMQTVKNSVEKLYKEALELTNGINPNDAGFAPINKAFEKLPPTIEGIDEELNVAKAKVFCMGNNVDAENVLRQYEEVKQDIENLEKFIAQNSKTLETTEAEMDSLRDRWLKPLNEIVDKINANFSNHFSAMNCAGEVTLDHGDNILDYDQYGLKIRVKFRDTDQLQVLTRHHQSGGEKAVTTAIYMIALQELCRVPFRCVDEINQGMDATNERRVFNLLVKITGAIDSSQYFFLTPKLLPDLEYSDTVSVHCVFNGPFVISHTEFEVEEYCKHIAKVLKRKKV